MSKVKILFVCVNYNNAQITLNYIKDVLQFKEQCDLAIAVVDNASKNEDVLSLENSINTFKDSCVKLIKSGLNLGYFGGLNLGITWGVKNGFEDFQIVGNNDIEFDKNFIKNLLNLEIDKRELVLAPDVVTINGIHENPHVINRVSKKRKLMYDIYYSSYFIAKIITLFYSTDRKQKEYDPERKYIYMGIGALYVLTPFFFQHYKKLREDVFLYGEEAILADQINKVNGKILYEPLLKCFHNESSTTSKMIAKNKYKIIQSSYKKYRKYL